MPSKENKNVNYKAKLENKLYLAQESPEPVFDVSDCNLKAIPANVFPLCRVLRKEALYMQNNSLTSLTNGGSLTDLKFLKVLNISANRITKIPSSINELVNLEVFDASRNELTELPNTIGDLRNLISLNLSHNHLKQIPTSIGNCKDMEVLNLTDNENLRELPVTLGRLHSLLQLEIDTKITYPPSEVCSKGVYEILKFLSKELKEDIEIPSTSRNIRKSIPNFDNIEKKIEFHEKQKLEKQTECLRLQKELIDQNQKELEAHKRLQSDKKKLLEDVRNQQESLEAKVTKLQEKKNVDRILLIQVCQDEEAKSNDVVEKMLKIKRNLQMLYSKEWENERKAEEAMLLSRTIQSKELERKKILASMEELIKAEILKAQSLNDDKRYCAAQSLAYEFSAQNDVLKNLFKKRIENQSQLIDSLRQNEEVQKSAVASLLEKSDAASWELAKQISIVEAQLADLTRLEIKKKHLELESQVTELAKNRMALTELLMNLLHRQRERRDQLVNTIRKMETLKESARDSETFWMEKYEKLLNSKAHEMVKFLESIDTALVYQLYINEVFQYLPLLKDFILSGNKLEDLNEAVLIKLGIQSCEDRSKILRATSLYLESEYLSRVAPTAPLLEEPSAPLVDSSDSSEPKKFNSAFYLVPDECVICLETKPSVIFVPCGHICCCNKCFNSVEICPLCRREIEAVHEIQNEKQLN